MASETFIRHFDLAEEKLAAAELIRVSDASPSADWGKLVSEAQVHATLAVAAAAQARQPIHSVNDDRLFTNQAGHVLAEAAGLGCLDQTGNRVFIDQAGRVVAEADGAGYLDQTEEK